MREAATRQLAQVRRVAWRYALYALLAGFLALFLIWPIGLTVRGGIVDPDGHFTLRYIAMVFQDPVLTGAIGNSLLVAVLTTLAAFALALPLSVLGARYEFTGKSVVTGLVLVPLILPPFVGAIGMQALLGRAGALNALLMGWGLLAADGPGIDWLGGGVGGRLWGVVLMQALHLYPILYLNLTAALANVDPTLEEAALNLGASRWRRFIRVTVPLIFPGIFAGVTIVFIWAFTELGTPLMFDYYAVAPVQVFWGLQEVADNPRPYALVIVMLSVAAGCYLAGRLTLGRAAWAMQGKASVGATTHRLRGVAGLAAAAAFLLVTAIAVLPHLGVVITSFSVEGTWYGTALPAGFTLGHYTEALSHELSMRAMANSLLYSVAAMLVAVSAGVTIAYLVVRARVRGGWLLDTTAMLPLAVPGLVVAFGYVAMTFHWPFAPGDPLGGLFSVMGENPNPVPLLVVAYAIGRLPLIVRAASAGFAQTSGQLEEAALNLGASGFYAIRRVVIPLIMANVIAGAILVFAFSMLAVSDSLVLAQTEAFYPITMAIWTFFNRLGDGPYIAAAMGVWGMLLLTITLVGASMLMGRRLGAVFRI